jgi:hypothetical protein
MRYHVYHCDNRGEPGGPGRGDNLLQVGYFFQVGVGIDKPVHDFLYRL